MAEYPGVRLGQRGGLYDLYQYYLSGGDQTEAPVSTVNTTQFIQPVSGGQGDGQVGGGYVPEYLPRDAQGFQIQPESQGSGIFSSQYRPDNFGVDRNIATFGAVGKPIMSGYIEEDEEPNFLDRVGTRTRSFFDNLGSSGIGTFARAIGGPLISGASYLSRIGRPVDAIYSYGGDQTGFGSRAALTAEEVRNMEFLEAMGGVNELGQDKYGINTVSAFGDYTAYNEKRVGELNDALLDAQKKYGGKTDKYFDMTTRLRKELEDRTGLQESIEADEDKTAAQIDAKNKMTLDNAYLTSKIKPTTVLGQDVPSGITSTITTPSNVEMSEGAEGGGYDAGAVSSSSQGVSSAGNTAPSTSRGPAGGATTGGGNGGGGAAAGMGGGSQQATSAGSTNSGRSDGGWGWKDGGLVTRKPYGDGGIVDLL